MNKKKHIVVLATGGTIAGAGEAGKATDYAPGSISIQTLLDGVESLKRVAEVTGIQVVNVNSDDITGDIWIDLARRINRMAMDPAVDGFVITHGTDTLEETAYFLHLTVKTEKPVVITGSMRPSTAISADGPMNMLQAVSVAACDDARGKGVLCVFSDAIYGARNVQKVSMTSVTAFDNRDLGMLGCIVDGHVIFYNQPAREHTVRSVFEVEQIDHLPKVEIISFYTDADPELLRFAGRNADGLVIAGAGNGNYSRLFHQAVGEMGIPVVRSSRISGGVITPDSAFDEWGNIIRSDNLPPTKAKILLQLALTRTNDIELMQKFFTVY
ncbi:MAG: asparaginase [Clostridia bacterium]|nr:asparaginase [Clostridia bacterium]